MNTKTKPDAAHEIVHLVEIASTPERVYEAVTTQSGLASWWTQDTRAQAKVGAVNEFTFHGPRQVTFRLRVEELRPAQLVRWSTVEGPPEWKETTIAFHIQGAGQGTLLRFVHGPFESTGGAFGVYNFNWAAFLLSLKSLLETGKGNPAPAPTAAAARKA